MSDSLWPHKLYSPWNSPGRNTGGGSLSLLQGIIPTQGSKPGLPHCRQILYQLSHKGSPRILEWVAYLFSSRSSQPRNQTGVSCIADGFFTNWATRRAHVHQREKLMAIFKEILDWYETAAWVKPQLSPSQMIEPHSGCKDLRSHLGIDTWKTPES